MRNWVSTNPLNAPGVIDPRQLQINSSPIQTASDPDWDSEPASASRSKRPYDDSEPSNEEIARVLQWQTK